MLRFLAALLLSWPSCADAASRAASIRVNALPGVALPVGSLRSSPAVPATGPAPGTLIATAGLPASAAPAGVTADAAAAAPAAASPNAASAAAPVAAAALPQTSVSLPASAAPADAFTPLTQAAARLTSQESRPETVLTPLFEGGPGGSLDADAPALPRADDSAPLQPPSPPGPAQRPSPPPAPRLGGLPALMGAHALGIFNDTAFKTLLAVWAAAALPKDQAAMIIGLATALFTLPFVALSVAAGRLADRKDKRGVVVAVKAAELALAAGGVAALAFGSAPAALAVVLLLGVKSALLSPSKYSLLAERAEPAKLGRANGRFELATFAALLLGTAAGGLMVANAAPVLPALAAFPILAAAGLWAARRIPKGPAPAPAAAAARQPIARPLKLAMAGVAFFWFASSLLQMNLLLYAQHALHVGPAMVTAMLTTIGVATGLGSAAAGLLSKNKIELGLAPIGALAVAIGLLDLGLFPGSLTRAFFDLALLSASGGLFDIPLNAFLQQQSAPEHRGHVLGVNNLVTFAAIFLSAGVFWFLATALGAGPAAVFAILGVAALAAAAACAWLLRSQLSALLRRLLGR